MHKCLLRSILPSLDTVLPFPLSRALHPIDIFATRDRDHGLDSSVISLCSSKVSWTDAVARTSVDRDVACDGRRVTLVFAVFGGRREGERRCQVALPKGGMRCDVRRKEQSGRWLRAPSWCTSVSRRCEGMDVLQKKEPRFLDLHEHSRLHKRETHAGKTADDAADCTCPSSWTCSKAQETGTSVHSRRSHQPRAMSKV